MQVSALALGQTRAAPRQPAGQTFQVTPVSCQGVGCQPLLRPGGLEEGCDQRGVMRRDRCLRWRTHRCAQPVTCGALRVCDAVPAGLFMSDLAPAPLWRRLAAAVYDTFALLALWMLAAALVLLLFPGRVDLAQPPPFYNAALRSALLAATTLYYVLSWLRGGQTIGGRAWQLGVVDAAGGRLSTPRALLRFAVAILSWAAVGLGFLWCLVDRQRRSWHDLAAGTLVVHQASRRK